MTNVILLTQRFILNPNLTVAKVAQEAGVEITDFVRFEIGEDTEKFEANLPPQFPNEAVRLGQNSKNKASRLHNCWGAFLSETDYCRILGS